MTGVKNLHSADGSFLGFLFQIERVLVWLSNAESGGMIGVEVDDDIVVQLQKGNTIETIYEQAKNSQQRNKTPFSDKSEDLWKTLCIWVKLVTQRGVDPEKSFFSAISNKKIPNGRLLQILSDASRENEVQLREVCQQLKSKAGELRAGLKEFGKTIQDCDDYVLASIVSRVTVFDSEYSHDATFKKVLKKNLRMSDDLPFDYIYNALFGYVTNVLINSWKRGEEGWIEVNSFLNMYTALIAEYKKKKFIEKATSSLPVSTKEIANHRNKIYVDQLRAIGCDEEEILENIEHYLRASSEKSRYAQTKRQELMQKPDVSESKQQVKGKDKNKELDQEDQPGKKQSKSRKVSDGAGGEGVGLIEKKRTGTNKGMGI